MARRFTTSRFSARLNWILSMYGNWLPSVSTQMLYGFRSKTHSGVVHGCTVFHGETTGRSGFLDQSLANFKKYVTQLSNLASAACLSTVAWVAYFGWNFIR